MPRNVRNFFMVADVDGKQEDVATGPRNRDGGMSLHISQRENGSVKDVLYIASRARLDGKLETSIYDENDKLIHTVVTER